MIMKTRSSTVIKKKPKASCVEHAIVLMSKNRSAYKCRPLINWLPACKVEVRCAQMSFGVNKEY